MPAASAAIAVLLAFTAPVFAQEHAGHGTVSKSTPTAKQAEAPPVITLSPDKVQLIGVRTAVVEMRPLGKQIRTVGKVEPDETRLAFVNTKIAGWVKKLYVDYTGKEVVKGQPLLSIYSPDLVTAQEEYLIALRSARRAGQEAGGMPEAEASRRELLESAKRRLQLWDITDEQIAELEKTGKPQTDMTIEAPLSGIVLEKMVLEGGYITPGMNLYRIADLSSVWITADIYEYEVPLVRAGQAARVTLPYQSGQALLATVNYIYPTLDPVSRTVKVRLTMKNPGLMLKPEMFANVEINVSSGARLAIPKEAVLDSGRRQIVYVEKKPGVYEMRQVTLGVRGEEYVEVLKGIKKGERVVTSGNFLIDSESQLRTGQ
jgi:Cu(I)/Ag(I) efflux system membrane fusion protein